MLQNKKKDRDSKSAEWFGNGDDLQGMGTVCNKGYANIVANKESLSTSPRHGTRYQNNASHASSHLRLATPLARGGR